MKYVSIFIILVTINSCKGPRSDFADMNPVNPSLTLASGKVLRYENFSSEFVRARNIDVWLPDNYDKDKKYAVLYMHDGQMLFDASTTWNKQEWGVDETVSKLTKAHKIKDCIIVGIWNIPEYRHTDYFPKKPFFYLNKSSQDSILSFARGQNLMIEEIQSDNYLKFIVTELKPFIDYNFSTLPDRANTFVAGSSMGGLISMYALTEYPDVFGGAACLSTHWIGTFSNQNNPVPNAFMRYMEENLPDSGRTNCILIMERERSTRFIFLTKTGLHKYSKKKGTKQIENLKGTTIRKIHGKSGFMFRWNFYFKIKSSAKNEI